MDIGLAGFDPDENVTIWDKLYSVVDPLRNLHILKKEILYKPFNKSVEKSMPATNGNIPVACMGKTLYFNNHGHIGDVLHDVFINEIYSRLNVNGRQVIDIGATVGDTAIYFCVRGARSVHAYECDKRYYSELLKNVALNGLEKEITPHNTAVASLNGMRIEDGAVLKMDCEGCEYPVILGARAGVLERFSEIMMEYHYGYLNLRKRLGDAGFKVTVTRPQRSGVKGGMAGLLYATRNENRLQ